MASRKTTLSPGPGPSGGRSMVAASTPKQQQLSSKTNKVLISKEYQEATSLLNEETMNKACWWLLQAGNQSGGDKKSDTKMTEGPSTSLSSTTSDAVEDQLLELYHQCQDAVAVIRKHQPSATAVAAAAAAASSGLPGAPNLLPSSKLSARASSVGGGPGGGGVGSSSMAIGYSKGQPIPIRRTGMHGLLSKPKMSLHGHHPRHGTHFPHQHRGSLGGTSTGVASFGGGRDRSNSDFGATGGSGTVNVNNSSNIRQQMSPPPPPDTTMPVAPPKSALVFLAKLNKGETDAGQSLQSPPVNTKGSRSGAGGNSSGRGTKQPKASKDKGRRGRKEESEPTAATGDDDDNMNVDDDAWSSSARSKEEEEGEQVNERKRTPPTRRQPQRGHPRPKIE